MRADLDLKTKQSFWETPRTIVFIVGAAVAVAATLAGLAGYKFGQTASAPSIQVLQLPPGTTITVPSAPAPK